MSGDRIKKLRDRLNSKDNGLTEVSKKSSRVGIKKPEQILEIDINEVIADENQPRKIFDKEKLEELADSIDNTGQLQPITAYFDSNISKYVVVLGGRRHKAIKDHCKLTKTIKLMLVNKNNENKQFHENEHRADLTDLETALHLKKRVDEAKEANIKLRLEDLAKEKSKSLTWVSKLLGIFDLPEIVLNDLIGNMRNIPITVLSSLRSLKNEDLICKYYEDYKEGTIARKVIDDKVKEINQLKKQNINISEEKIDNDTSFEKPISNEPKIKEKKEKRNEHSSNLEEFQEKIKESFQIDPDDYSSFDDDFLKLIQTYKGVIK